MLPGLAAVRRVVVGGRAFGTKPARRSPPKLARPVPLTAGDPVVLDNGCTFVDLRAKARTNFEAATSLPPVVANRGGEYLPPEGMAAMRSLRQTSPEQWSITQLARRFRVSRSLVMRQALTETERQACQQEVDERLLRMSTRQQRGWILRHRIRHDREASW